MRRAQRNQQENVVEFSAYHQQAQQQYAAQAQYAAPQPAAAQPPAYQQPQNPAPAAPQQAMEPQPTGAHTVCTRIINARGMVDCRSAITLLRKGECVLIVLENVADPAEMRRLVDTLSGACYSLTATITKVSRYGVYLLAPQTVAVFADQATSMMNSVPGRQPRSYQPNPAPQRTNYPPQAGYQPQMAYQPQPTYQPQAAPAQGAYQPQPGYAMPQQPFTQRAAMPAEAPRDFYQRPAPQEAQAPAFAGQQPGYGYAPEETEAVDQ